MAGQEVFGYRTGGWLFRMLATPSAVHWGGGRTLSRRVEIIGEGEIRGSRFGSFQIKLSQPKLIVLAGAKMMNFDPTCP